MRKLKHREVKESSAVNKLPKVMELHSGGQNLDLDPLAPDSMLLTIKPADLQIFGLRTSSHFAIY